MSIEIMSHIWKNGPKNQSETIVLLALADYANDEGECWPSIGGLMKKSRLSDRGVQKVLRRLEAQGWLKIKYSNGRKNCNFYIIQTPNLSVETPNEVHPERGSPPPETPNLSAKTPNEVHPERGSPPPETPNLSAKTPNLSAKNPEPGSPEPSITINKPSVSNKRAREEVVDLLSKWASREAAESFVKYRRTHKSKSLSVTGAKRLANNLKKIFNAGHDPSDALGMAEERGWASVELSWYVKKGSVNDRTHNGQRAAMGEDPAIDQITRVVGALQASREYCN